METAIVSILAFGLIVLALVYIRTKTGNKYEIRNSDILIALIPVAIGLVLTGKIRSLAFGDFKIESAFLEASQAAISEQVTKPQDLPVEAVDRRARKGGVEEIPRMIEKKTEALVFKLGHGGYWGPAIREHLEELSRYAFFKYIIITHDDGRLFGIADARKTAGVLLAGDGKFTTENFARWLNHNDIADLAELPGFVPARKEIKRTTDKLKVLEIMERDNLPLLPVTDEQDRFAGIVDRGQLAASLIIDVARRIQK